MSSRLLLLLSLVAISPSLHSQQLQQATHTQVQAETGQQVYAEYCAVCHLTALSGSFEAFFVPENPK